MDTRPETLWSVTRNIPTGYGKLYMTITALEPWGYPYEVFVTVGKSGKSIEAKAEVVGRLCSLALRHNVPVTDVVKQLLDIAGEQPIMTDRGLVKSVPDAVGKLLDAYMKHDWVGRPLIDGCIRDVEQVSL
jgi:ribonucleoside-diphosphate reductase alpha chain